MFVVVSCNVYLCYYNHITCKSSIMEEIKMYTCFRSGHVCKLIYKNKKLSYTRARECIVSRLKEVSGDLNIGLHSLRASGAMTAANANINVRCWQRHGRSKSDSAKDGYVADSLNSCLEMTKQLHL